MQVRVALKDNIAVALGRWKRTSLKSLFPLSVIVKNCLKFGVACFPDVGGREVKRYKTIFVLQDDAF